MYNFPKIIEIGWRANFSPENHPVSQYEFDVLIGADGKRNTLEGIYWTNDLDFINVIYFPI